MLRRTAAIGLAAALLAACALPAPAAQRTVLAEMFGASWCGYCPNARAALVQLQEEYGTDNLVVLYYHLNDSYATAETHARAGYYQVGGVPEVDFDAVTEVVGAGTSVYDVYKPIVEARMAEPTPVTMVTEGVIRPAAHPDSSWVTVTFRAVDTIPSEYGQLDAQFVVYENTSALYPWTVRDMLAAADITSLTAPGDSIVVTRRFVVDPAWSFNDLHVAVFLEDQSPKVVVNAQIMPDPFDNEFVHTDRYASQIDYMGEAVYHTTLRNSGVMTDTITVSVAHDELPDGMGPYDWITLFCDSSGTCYFTPWEYVLAPGQAETFDVHVVDNVGNVRGMALTTITAASAGDTNVVSTESFATFVDMPSILLVDDDGGGTYESYLETALVDTGYKARVWDADANGRPTLTQLQSYWAVLWTTANGSADYIGGACVNNMASYLDGGGNLLLSSMEFLSSRVNTLAFIPDYLHVESWANDSGGFVMAGEDGDVISSGMDLNLLGGPFAPNNSDTFVATAPATQIFSSPAGTEGIRVEEDGHKVVFLSFPFEDVKVDDPYPDNQKTLIARILNWFSLPSGVEDAEVRRLALGPNYPNPFNPVTKIAFTVPEGAERVTLTVHNVAGEVVRTLVDEAMSAGPALAVWDGRDDRGRPLASGVYFARIVAGGESACRKMTLLK